MSDPTDRLLMLSHSRVRLLAGVFIVAVFAGGVWLWTTRGLESTDDAQVDARVTPIAARVGGAVRRVAIADNEKVEAGAVLVELDPHDYEVAVEKARAELADAEASALAADTSVPITSTMVTSGLATARQSAEQAAAAVEAARKEVEAARARLAATRARQREVETNAAKASRDVDRLRGLLEKDEISQQQFDSASASEQGQRAVVESAAAQVAEAEAAVFVAESRLAQAQAGGERAQAEVRGAETAPEQIAASKARAASAEARVAQAKATLRQAELHLQYATVMAPTGGVVSKKSVNFGQVIQPGQPLMALVELDQVWVIANFKETQVAHMRAGQRAIVKVDAFGSKAFEGQVESISPATGARFSLLPPENATGNFVKVVQRVPVKIALTSEQDPEHLLRPGMSVVATIDTR